MITHIGNNEFIYNEDIIAILDKKSAEASSKTREFLKTLIDMGRVIGDINQYTKSYIIVSNGKDDTILYTSNISSKALSNRKDLDLNI